MSTVHISDIRTYNTQITTAYNTNHHTPLTFKNRAKMREGCRPVCDHSLVRVLLRAGSAHLCAVVFERGQYTCDGGCWEKEGGNERTSEEEEAREQGGGDERARERGSERARERGSERASKQASKRKKEEREVASERGGREK